MTTYADYTQVFKAATDHPPYPYQSEFATRQDLPALLSVPTGCGKTAAAILGWLWRRQFASLEVGEASDDQVSGSSGAEANSLEIDVLGNVSQGRTMESHYPCRMSLSPRWLPG